MELMTNNSVICSGRSPGRRRDSGEAAVEELDAGGGGAEERARVGRQAEAQEPRQAHRRLPGAAGEAARLRVCAQPEPRSHPIRYVRIDWLMLNSSVYSKFSYHHIDDHLYMFPLYDLRDQTRTIRNVNSWTGGRGTRS